MISKQYTIAIFNKVAYVYMSQDQQVYAVAYYIKFIFSLLIKWYCSLKFCTLA